MSAEPFTPLAFDAPLAAHEARVRELLAGQRARAAEALAFTHRFHPRFREAHAPWKVRELTREEVAAEPFELADARLAQARAHDFADWAALVAHATAMAEGGTVARFEGAVEAVVGGELAALQAALDADPALVRARSSRRTPFDPPVHAATLLHYVAANGVEGSRQRTPPNAVAIARTLLAAGAEVDSPAYLYGGPCGTLALLVSSAPPARAGLQGALVELLLDHGAALEGCGERWGTPLVTALVFGQREAAETLVRRGARTDSLVAAAGLGRAREAERLLPRAGALERHRALALAAQLGHAGVVALLLDAGEDPDRFNPAGLHAHATPLHQAALGGHRAVVELLVERGARLDRLDGIHGGTPLGWARHAGWSEVEAFLRARGAI